MIWTKTRDRVKNVGLALGFFALGVWADGIYNHTAKLPWLHQQAAAVQPLKKELKQTKQKEAQEHCDADVMHNTAALVVGADLQKEHCPPGYHPKALVVE